MDIPLLIKNSEKFNIELQKINVDLDKIRAKTIYFKKSNAIQFQHKNQKGEFVRMPVDIADIYLRRNYDINLDQLKRKSEGKNPVKTITDKDQTKIRIAFNKKSTLYSLRGGNIKLARVTYAPLAVEIYSNDYASVIQQATEEYTALLKNLSPDQVKEWFVSNKISKASAIKLFEDAELALPLYLLPERNITLKQIKTPNKEIIIDEPKVFDLKQEETKTQPVLNYSMKEVSKKRNPIEMATPIKPTEIKKNKTVIPKPKIETSLLSVKYDNPYLLNKAIEKLIAEKGNSEYTIDEKLFIAKFTGYGGLNDYMDEGEYDNRFAFEYYTPEMIVQKMWGLAFKNGYKSGLVLEPAAGIGNFLRYVPPGENVITYEINPISHRILEILYPEYQHENKSFETKFITGRLGTTSIKGKTESIQKFDLIIGNPPYGDYATKIGGYGEQAYTKASNYIEYFISRGIDALESGGLLIYIIGSEIANGGIPFLCQGNTKVKDAILDKAEFIDAYRLPQGVFDRTDVLSDIVVFKKK